MKSLGPRAVQGLHVATDVTLVGASWVGAWWLRRALDDVLANPINPLDAYLGALPMIALAWVFSCWLFGIYRPARMKTGVDELRALFRGTALGLLVVGTLSFFFKELHFGRFVVLASAGFNLLLLGASRYAFHRVERGVRRSGRHDVPALIVGTGTAAIRLLQKLQDHPEIGYRVMGFLDETAPADGKDVAGRPVLGAVDALREVVILHGVQEVFVAMPSLEHTHMLSLVLDCEDLGVTFRCVTNLFEVLTAGTRVDLVDDLPVVRLGREQVDTFYEPLKRAFDLAGALLGLALVWPVMLWCALRIRLDSPGPAIFRQPRVGRDGRTFEMLKFRTMGQGADPAEVAPRAADDPRITRYGRWLRVSSLDELPQLWNVVRGEMSLVGPRPEMPFIVEEYDAWQRRRLAVLPGITGLWQILGRKDLPMHENLQYDFYYIRNRSIALDASILLRTVGAVLSRRGAF